ncbi:hypothetical protein KIPB_010082 [Kipferlia bialata]|uniref:Uncharacterized protein n=1 Tax=Kipferlia bialata TaxID=797122 RepID=A0A9K3D4S3_9EUKA|nr:hypothetical protein KIPB_010082 [Kipferlia bialata]|eukprot:g10082.t1
MAVTYLRSAYGRAVEPFYLRATWRLDVDTLTWEKNQGQYILSVPMDAGSVQAYDTISGEWQDWGTLQNVQTLMESVGWSDAPPETEETEWKDIHIENASWWAEVGDEVLVATATGHLSLMHLQPEWVYPHDSLRWAEVEPRFSDLVLLF